MKYVVLAGSLALFGLSPAYAGDPNMAAHGSRHMEAGSSAGNSSANQSDRSYSQKNAGPGYNPPSSSGGGQKYITPGRSGLSQ